MSQYASDLQALIKSLDKKNMKGWILDLRQNTGGNCWPMLAGLGPLLGNGICGYFIDNRNNKSSWYYKDGKAGVNSTEMSHVNSTPYKLFNENNPIALLTGPSTASSGEVIVTSFRGKANVKCVGQSTAGLTTGNSNFTLSDGSMIFLTTSIYADRHGNPFGGKMTPDIIEHSRYDKMNSANDPVINRAIDWINLNR
ncbi:MAG: hypothetical protein C0490_23035 [Marivirga sp.]|nr:hypothetical protein [Marivirga sp.]